MLLLCKKNTTQTSKAANSTQLQSILTWMLALAIQFSVFALQTKYYDIEK